MAGSLYAANFKVNVHWLKLFAGNYLLVQISLQKLKLGVYKIPPTYDSKFMRLTTITKMAIYQKQMRYENGLTKPIRSNTCTCLFEN